MNTREQNELTPYEQGFMSKCAELGVDPEVLLKRAAGKLSPARLVEIFNNPKLLASLREVPRAARINQSDMLAGAAHRLWSRGIDAERAAAKLRNTGIFGRLFNRGKASKLRSAGEALRDKSRELSDRAFSVPVSKYMPEEVLYNQEQLGALAKLRDRIAGGAKPVAALENLSLAHGTYPASSMLDLPVVRALVKSRPDLFAGLRT